MSRSKNDVLIIEDNMEITILSRFSKEIRVGDVETCNTRKAGILLFSDIENTRKRPIILLDFRLPDMDANEVMASIFNIRPNAKIILETADIKV